jgi:hypothetical protein
MSRVFRSTLSALAAVLSLVALTAASAQAKVLHVTGQQTTITPSAQATKFFATQNVSMTPLGTATIANASLTLPISGGFVTTPKLNGVLRHKGGIKFTDGTRSLSLRGFVLARVAGRTFLSAKAAGKRLIVARVTKLTTTVSGKQAVITGELKLSAAAARGINRLFGHHVVKAGAEIGSLTSTVSVR